MLIHLVTEKGRGYLPAEKAPDKMHGVGKYDPITGKQQKSKGMVRFPLLQAVSGIIPISSIQAYVIRPGAQRRW